jgi:putative Mg2+ transporter-C (MgtC) family protein
MIVSLALSAAIGFERERQRRAAGFRTHMLVGLAATLFVSLGGPVLETYALDGHPSSSLNYDPNRLIGAVVSGVSFLGAGTIFVARGKHVQGLTTAASMWVTAAIGVAVAVDRYLLAVTATIIIFVVLSLLGKLEERIKAAAAESDPGAGQ